MVRKPIRWILIVGGYVIAGAIALEALLRLAGYQPEVKHTRDLSFIQPDSLLGWRHLPGKYDVRPFKDPGQRMIITLKRDTGRMTRAYYPPSPADKILFIGGSFIMGYGVDDDETVPWQVQQRFPHLDIRNLGVGAYGTYQSLLTLEQQLEKFSTPRCVIYGAMNNHPYRDVAIGNWLEAIFGWYVPYVTLSRDGHVKRSGLIKRMETPYSDQLALSLLVRRTLNRLSSLGRARDAKKVSRLLIKQMHQLVTDRGGAFYVALLHYNEREIKELVPFLEAEGIPYINCNVELTDANTIKNDGHPLPEVHAHWAAQIGNRLLQDGIVPASESLTAR